MTELIHLEGGVPVDKIVTSDTKNLVERSTVPGSKRRLWKIGAIVFAGLLLFSCVAVLIVTLTKSSSSTDAKIETDQSSGGEVIGGDQAKTQQFADVKTETEDKSASGSNADSDLLNADQFQHGPRAGIPDEPEEIYWTDLTSVEATMVTSAVETTAFIDTTADWTTPAVETTEMKTSVVIDTTADWRTPTPDHTDPTEPTEPPEPTETPEPTGTPVPTEPTETPEPTGTPVPTPSDDREPPVYETILFGNFTSFPDGDFDFDCTNRYSNELRDRASGMIPVVNSKLGIELCTRYNTEDFTMMSVSTILTTEGSRGETDLSFKTVLHNNLFIDDVYDCMAEVSYFLRDHVNWGLPLLPQLPGCPYALFDPAVFYTTGDKWFCISTSQESAPAIPGYELDIASNFTTIDETDLSSKCASDYSNDLTEKVAVMQFTLNNEQLGTHLCSEVSITVITSTSSLVYQGPKGIASVQFIMQSADNQRFIDIFNCADEVLEFVLDHANWGLPLLPQIPGCPFLVFHEQRFYEEGQRWICLS